MNYTELLKDPRWQKKRLEIMQRDGFACALCMDETSTLHVHHKKYKSGCAPWEYEDKYLITLCDSCHGKQHGGSAPRSTENTGSVGRITLLPGSFALPCYADQISDAREKLKAYLTLGMVRRAISHNDGYMYVKADSVSANPVRHRIKINGTDESRVSLIYTGVTMWDRQFDEIISYSPEQ